MRFSARYSFLVRTVFSLLLAFGMSILLLSTPSSAFAQTPSPNEQPSAASNFYDFRTPDIDPNVPHNSHTYTQAIMIDILSAFICQLTGIDPVNPRQACLDLNPQTGKLGFAPHPNANQFGQNPNGYPPIGGALGGMTNLVSILYTPTVSSGQYFQYLSDNFGIVKTAHAQGAGTNCSTSPFGYGFCGLQPIFNLWKTIRDFSYALLVVAFIVLGVGVMLRFRVDPRTVMTLQNQIPRVIIAIILITFSYAIAGVMIDLMWTATYAGVNIITNGSGAKVAQKCGPDDIKPLPQAASINLLNQPVSFVDTIFLKDCNNVFDSGIVQLSSGVADAFGGLVASIIFNILGIDIDNLDCGLITGNPIDCIWEFITWLTKLIIALIIIIAILIALFRLWFELIKTYFKLLIFIILGPVWIVFGLIPGRPMGFEKWLRLIFSNLAAFPLVAYLLVFARVLIDNIATNPNPQSIFIPPLVGNPNVVGSFGVLMGFGAILIAPSIPAMIQERMKVKPGKFGAAIAGGIGAAAGAATAPANRMWKRMNAYDQHGNPVGVLAVRRYNLIGRIPGIQKIRGRGAAARQRAQSSRGGGGV